MSSLLHTRRQTARRSWALRTLRLHVEADGHCAFCSAHYACTPEWPCLPARIAQLYAGRPSRTAGPSDPAPLA